MNKFADRIEQTTPSFDSAIEMLTESTSGYVTWFKPKTEADKEQLIKLRATLSELETVLKGALHSVRIYQDSLKNLEGYSRDLNRAARRVNQSVSSVISRYEKLEAFSVRSLSLIDEKLTNLSILE